MKAIVYTSNTGHTAEYARMLGKKTGLPVFSLKDAVKEIDKETRIIYLGWLFANNVRGYKKANKKFRIAAVCAVGLCDTGTAIPDVRKVNSLPESMPLFTMRGGIDKTKLRGFFKLMINMLTKGLSAQKERSENEEETLHLLTHDKNYVSEDNMTAVLEWYDNQNTAE
ncbi:MAG: hypothetical protein ACI4SK_06010 [Christensenellales bacterium]